jgi:hypothetical protein
VTTLPPETGSRRNVLREKFLGVEVEVEVEARMLPGVTRCLTRYKIDVDMAVVKTPDILTRWVLTHCQNYFDTTSNNYVKIMSKTGF